MKRNKHSASGSDSDDQHDWNLENRYEGLSNTRDPEDSPDAPEDGEESKQVEKAENGEASPGGHSDNGQSLILSEIGEAIETGSVELGIDFLTLYAQPLDRVTGAGWEFDYSSVLNDSENSLRQTVTRIASTGHQYRVYVTDTPGAPLFLSVTFNPSEFEPLVGIGEAIEIAEVIWDELEDIVILDYPVDEARIGRIDIAADFAPVHNLSEALRTADLATPRRGWLKRLTSRNGAVLGSSVEHWTTSVGSIVVYDKSRQAGLDEPTLRIEARITKKARRKYGLELLRDATPERLLEAFRALSEPFTKAFVAAPKLGSATSKYLARHIAEAVGTLALEESGIILPISKNRRVMYRRILNELQVRQVSDIADIADIADIDESSN